ncbi:MAG: hypothetical protein RLZZ437_2784 [Pseudomonadota bacterium]
MKVINLNKARKAKAREDARTAADANAAKFGLTKSAREKLQAEAAKAKRDLDGHKRE